MPSVVLVAGSFNSQGAATMKRIKREVIQCDVRFNPGHAKHWAVGGYTVCELECGHVETIKNSRRIPEYITCKTCESLRAGSVYTLYDLKSRTATECAWDPVTCMPQRTNRKMTKEEVDKRCRAERSIELHVK